MASEKNFENRVKKWLESEGIYAAGTPKQKIRAEPCGWYFKVWGGGYQRSGIPDMLLNVNGIFIACELKGEVGKPTDLQKLNIAAINNSNGLGIILYPDGFEQFKNIVKGVKQCNVHILELNALKTANCGTNCDMLTSY